MVFSSSRFQLGFRAIGGLARAGSGVRLIFGFAFASWVSTFFWLCADFAWFSLAPWLLRDPALGFVFIVAFALLCWVS